jgi:hypothetical protein
MRVEMSNDKMREQYDTWFRSRQAETSIMLQANFGFDAWQAALRQREPVQVSQPVDVYLFSMGRTTPVCGVPNHTEITFQHEDKRTAYLLTPDYEALRKQLSQAEQAATVEAKIADEFRAECDVLRQRVAELEKTPHTCIYSDQVAEMKHGKAAAFKDYYKMLGIEDDGEYRWKWLRGGIQSAINKNVRLQRECDVLKIDFMGVLQNEPSHDNRRS